MAKFLVISDSFKGTMSSKEVNNIIKEELNKAGYYDVITYNASDGGEGFIDSVMNVISGEKLFLETTGPNFQKIISYYLFDSLNYTAYLELATTSGLSLANPKNPLETTTYGLGEQIIDALNKGAKKIYIGLGGSATNDAGLGALSALGVKFYNDQDDLFIPTGGTLGNIKKYDYTGLDNRLSQVEINLVCDVTNPLYGLNGATYVYAPQKGANLAQIITLDNNLRYLDQLISQTIDVESSFSSAGAAGGIPYGFKAFLKSKIISGSKFFLYLINFSRLAKQVDYIISGEGRLDESSFYGKLISEIINQAGEKAVVLFVGSIDSNLPKSFLKNIFVYPLVTNNLINEEILSLSQRNLQKAVRKFIDDRLVNGL